MIVGGLGVGPVCAARASCRWNVRVNCRQNSVPMGKVANDFLMWCLWLSSGVAISMGKTAKRVVFDGVRWSKLEEVSYKMLVLTLPHVSSCVSGAFFPLASCEVGIVECKV